MWLLVGESERGGGNSVSHNELSVMVGSPIGAGRLQQVAECLNVPVSVFFDETRGGPEEGEDMFAFLDSPIRFGSLRHLGKCQIALFNSASCN